MAITYAWHESDSKKKYRVTRQDGEPSITFTLGVEWDVNAVLDTLAELSKDKWIWMDQFSLIQENVTTEALASDIPTIYRNARVVAFLPYRVCSKLLSRIIKFRDDQDRDVSAALAEVMFHGLVCKCTDGLYGWLSRLWTWQELMLASSLRFVWGLGETKWARQGMFGDVEPSQDHEEKEEKQHSLSRLWTPAKSVGRLFVDSFKDLVSTLSVSDQPITKLMKERTQRNTESVFVPKEESATLSMGYYFCMRLLCEAEVYMPSASRTAPINCLKVLQQIASTGRKGGRVYDCYYAASAFIDYVGFLPKKKKSIAEQNQQDNKDDLNDEIALREAYIQLYEHEHARLRLPLQYQNILEDPKAVLQEYTKLYIKQNNRYPDTNGEDNAEVRQAFIDLYHEVHNSVLVKYTGAPVSTEYYVETECQCSFMDPYRVPIQKESYVADFHSIVWQTQFQYRLNLEKLISSLPHTQVGGGLPNAFVLSGMNEEMFCETKNGGEYFSGNAYDILSIKRIKVGRKSDLCFNSIRKIAKHLHPSQLTRVKNFNTTPSGLRMKLFPLAHATLHAAYFEIDPYPSHSLSFFRCSFNRGPRKTTLMR